MRVGLIGAGRIGAMHAGTLLGLAGVEALLVADADPARAQRIAGATAVGSVDELWAARIDAVVIAAPTPAHAPLIAAAAAAGVPAFCEKPIGTEAAEIRALLAAVAAAGIPLQIGFQRRFDAGYVALRDAVRSGRLGWLHTLRACTCDPAPPHPDFLATSGGIFRDLGVHDFDAIRWVTGREIARVEAVGANRGAPFFAEAGDVDTGAALLTLDDGTLAVCTATRYNGAGYDVRLEVCGSAGTMVAGLDERTPLVPAPPTGWPRERPYAAFPERFRDAYAAELAAFLDVAAGRIASPCTGEEALAAQLVADAAELSRRRGRAVEMAEMAGTDAGAP
jgi:myo-inositol 2-dehydrogenase/D-chiro-inositol 1-dehydrogenase